jgi:hypothetical protein
MMPGLRSLPRIRREGYRRRVLAISGQRRISSRVKLGPCAHPRLTWLLAATAAGLGWLAIGHWIRGG